MSEEEETERSESENRSLREISSYYVDSATARFSPYTYVLLLGVSDPSDAPEQTIPLVQLIMSPQHAKALAAHLMTTVAAYEDAYGTLSVPGLTAKFTLSVIDKANLEEAESADE